ncbi:MAG TPA: arsenate reductase family protein [Bacteroidota bacterium]|nr:arsenate reductase family protein [Bacteroidota bacterium]
MNNDKITIYQKPTCSTCRKVYGLLVESGIDTESVNYYVTPLSRKKLRELLRKMGISPRELLRKKEPLYTHLGMARTTLTDEEIIELMARHPDLIERPIVERGDRAVLARPPERLREIL